MRYKSPQQELIVEVLHSKLCGRCWPSKTVFAKRLDSFLSRLPSDVKQSGGLVAPLVEGEEPPEIEYNEGTVSSGLAAYPVGPHIPWNQTAIGLCSRDGKNPRNTWAYVPDHSISLEAIGYTNVQDKMPTGIHEGLPYVQWVYDNRCLLKMPRLLPPPVVEEPEPEPDLEPIPRPIVAPPGYETGRTIYVPRKNQGLVGDRHPAAAIVQSLSRIDGSIHVTCRLKYEDTELVLPMVKCNTKQIKHELWTDASTSTVPVSDTEPAPIPVKYPLELFTLFYYTCIVDQRVGLWGKDDSVMLIPFYEFYTKIRKLVRELEISQCKGVGTMASMSLDQSASSAGSDMEDNKSVYSPKVDKWVDMQLAYSETSMQWLCGGEGYHKYPLIQCNSKTNSNVNANVHASADSPMDLKDCVVDVRVLENIAVRMVMPQMAGVGANIAGIGLEMGAQGVVASMEEVRQAIAEDVIKSVAMSHSHNQTELTAVDEGVIGADGGTAVDGGTGTDGGDVETSDADTEKLNESAIRHTTRRTAGTLRSTIIEVANKIHAYRSPKKMSKSKSKAKKTDAEGDELQDSGGDVLNVNSLIEVFQVLDTQRAGELDIKEFVKALEMMGINCNEQVLEAISASFDTDGDGRISLEEFVEFVSHAPEQGRELGELWSIIRSGILSAEDEMAEVEDSGLPSVQDIQDNFELIIQERMLRTANANAHVSDAGATTTTTEDPLAGPYVSGSEFMSVIDGLTFRCDLEETDRKLLVKSFAELINIDEDDVENVDKSEKQESENENGIKKSPREIEILANFNANKNKNDTEEIEIDFDLYKFRYVDFLDATRGCAQSSETYVSHYKSSNTK